MLRVYRGGAALNMGPANLSPEDAKNFTSSQLNFPIIKVAAYGDEHEKHRTSRPSSK